MVGGGLLRLLSLSVIERDPFHEASVTFLMKASSGPFLREILAEKRKTSFVFGNGSFFWEKSADDQSHGR